MKRVSKSENNITRERKNSGYDDVSTRHQRPVPPLKKFQKSKSISILSSNIVVVYCVFRKKKKKKTLRTTAQNFSCTRRINIILLADRRIKYRSARDRLNAFRPERPSVRKLATAARNNNLLDLFEARRRNFRMRLFIVKTVVTAKHCPRKSTSDRRRGFFATK